MSKRFQKERESEGHVSSRRPSVPQETATRLFHVGARARKHVSDGHLAPGASRYSYRPQVEPQAPPPVYDRGEFRDLRQPSDLQLRAEQHRQPAKRKFKAEEDQGDTDDDQATDVDDEEENLPAKPQSMSSIKAFYVPSNYRASEDAMGDDFDDVGFLQPKETL